MALKEFMQHSMEYRGVLGQASKQESKEAYRHTGKQAGKHLDGIQSEPWFVLLPYYR